MFTLTWEKKPDAGPEPYSTLNLFPWWKVWREYQPQRHWRNLPTNTQAVSWKQRHLSQNGHGVRLHTENGVCFCTVHTWRCWHAMFIDTEKRRVFSYGARVMTKACSVHFSFWYWLWFFVSFFRLPPTNRHSVRRTTPNPWSQSASATAPPTCNSPPSPWESSGRSRKTCVQATLCQSTSFSGVFPIIFNSLFFWWVARRVGMVTHATWTINQENEQDTCTCLKEWVTTSGHFRKTLDVGRLIRRARMVTISRWEWMVAHYLTDTPAFPAVMVRRRPTLELHIMQSDKVEVEQCFVVAALIIRAQAQDITGNREGTMKPYLPLSITRQPNCQESIGVTTWC